MDLRTTVPGLPRLYDWSRWSRTAMLLYQSYAARGSPALPFEAQFTCQTRQCIWKPQSTQQMNAIVHHLLLRDVSWRLHE